MLSMWRDSRRWEQESVEAGMTNEDVFKVAFHVICQPMSRLSVEKSTLCGAASESSSFHLFI